LQELGEWQRVTLSEQSLTCNVGTIGHIDHGKTTTTAAILAVQAAKGLASVKSYSDIAKGGTVRDATKTVTIAASHVEYETDESALRTHRLPGPR
jgi:translation elongation factor EF-Tu-like GTPase